jgi:hypothetical protein
MVEFGGIPTLVPKSLLNFPIRTNERTMGLKKCSLTLFMPCKALQWPRLEKSLVNADLFIDF